MNADIVRSGARRPILPKGLRSYARFKSAPVNTYEFLEIVHQEYAPRSYLEIGVNTGTSLALSRTRTIGVDPAFVIQSDVHCDLQLVRATSDDFFARDDALSHFPDGRVDLAFVDGQHLIEYVLRDFINIERHVAWTSVILIDDVFPRYAARASRERGDLTGWTGDVFKLTEVLDRYRPDLLAIALDTYPTGLLLVLGANSHNRDLERHYEEIVAEYVTPDPQFVPQPILQCESGVDPDSIAHSELWSTLRRARESGEARDEGWEGVRRVVQATAVPTKRRKATPAAVRIASSGQATPRGARMSVRRRLGRLRRRLGRLTSLASGNRPD
jgi:hypothetical protein